MEYMQFVIQTQYVRYVHNLASRRTRNMSRAWFLRVGLTLVGRQKLLEKIRFCVFPQIMTFSPFEAHVNANP